MRITGLEDLHADAGWRKFSFLKLSTDEGLVGWSEFNEGFGAGGVAGIIQKLAPHVVGTDPRAVARLGATLRAMTRQAAGGLNHQAIAAIENACLDVKAKALGVPVYELFGGPVRDRLGLYWSHCGSFRAWQPDLFEKRLGMSGVRTLDDVKALGARGGEARLQGAEDQPRSTSIPVRRRVNPGLRPGAGPPERRSSARYIARITDVLAAFRDGAGPDIGIQLDLNFNFRTEGFLRIAQAVEPYALSWLEIDMHDPDALALVRRSTTTPIASLESLHGPREYRPFLARYAGRCRDRRRAVERHAGSRCASPLWPTPTR